MKLQSMDTAPREGQVLLVQELRPGKVIFRVGIWQDVGGAGYWAISGFGPDFLDHDFIGWIPLPEIKT